MKLVNFRGCFFLRCCGGGGLGLAWMQHVCESYPRVNFNLAGMDNEAPAWLCKRGCFLGGITDTEEGGIVFLLQLLPILPRSNLTLVRPTALQLRLHFLCG